MPKFPEHDDIIVHGVTPGNLLRVGSHGNIEDSGVSSIQVMAVDGDAVNGNVAKFDAYGQVLDSGIKSAEVTQLSAADQAKLANVLKQNDVLTTSTAGAITTSGIYQIVGGEGFALTLPAPAPGMRMRVNLESITSGAVTLACAAGSKFDPTNNLATFNAAGDYLEIVYKSTTYWYVVANNSVDLSVA